MIEAPSLRCGTAACTVKNTAVMLVLMTDLECLERGAAERRAAGDAGIGKHDVEFAEFFDRLLDRRFGRRDVGGVGDDRERVRPEFFGGRLQRRLFRPVMATRAPSATNSFARSQARCRCCRR